MSINLINIGTYPNDGTGDPLRTAFQKINDNFSEFSPVSFSGEYSSLYGTPAIANVGLTGHYSSLLGTPMLGTLAFLSSVNNNNWLGTPLSIQNGGTGKIYAGDAFNALSPISVPGDLIIGDIHGKGDRLRIGTNTQVLTVNNNIVVWSDSVGPNGYNKQIQFNNDGIFGGAAALTYQIGGTHLSISALSTNTVPLNIVAAPGQNVDLLDFTANGESQGGLAKFTSNGTLYTQGIFVQSQGAYIQGGPSDATSLELSNTHFYGQYFQLKCANGQHASYMTTRNGNEASFYQADGEPIWSISLGDDCQLHRPSPGTLYHHNYINPSTYKCFNSWQDDNNWEACGFDWATEPNVCRLGTDQANGVSRELHFMTGGTVSHKIDAYGNFVHALHALANTATDGFVYLPSCSGVPTGSPTFFSGTSPIVINQTNKRLHVNINGAWYYVTLTAD